MYDVILYASFDVNVHLWNYNTQDTLFHGACDSYVSIFAFHLHLSVHFHFSLSDSALDARFSVPHNPQCISNLFNIDHIF